MPLSMTAFDLDLITEWKREINNGVRFAQL